jgi:hypothetical protein
MLHGHLLKGPSHAMQPTHIYEVRPRKDHRGVDLIFDALPFGRLWYGEPNAISNAVDYAKFYSRSHDAVIRVFDEAGNVTRRAMRARVGWGRDPLLCGKSLHLIARILCQRIPGWLSVRISAIRIWAQSRIFFNMNLGPASQDINVNVNE